MIDVRRHNAGFCQSHFIDHIKAQVVKTIKEFKMFEPEDRLLIAVSGGKDSLAIWDILLDLGYDATGFYLDLGIGGYSTRSKEASVRFADERGAKLIVRSLQQEHGFTVPELSRLTGRVPCSGCGLNKRYEFNRAALEEGFQVLVTGHNLDDEVATLFGNVLHWQTEQLGRQAPMLEERVFGEGGDAKTVLVRKVKPLVRVAERESAAYAVLKGIDYIVEECPMAEGNRHLGMKAMLDGLEDRSPGTKAAFLFGFLERGAPRFAEASATERDALGACAECGSPTTGAVCAFCRLRERVAGPGRATEKTASEPDGAAILEPDGVAVPEPGAVAVTLRSAATPASG